jgi:hypothetical protein
MRDRVVRQRAEPDVRAQARGCVRRLAPRVPRTNHDNVECFVHVATNNSELSEGDEKISGLTELRVPLSFADAEPREDVLEQILGRATSADLFER